MRNCLIILFGAVIPWIIYLIINDIIELANFIVTAAAFGAAIYAIYYQHQESKQAEKNFKKQFDLQKEAALKQEIIGAWQVLANKASGNSGKKEAIEFLASQGLPLCGIDMSERTHGGPVYLHGLFQDFEGDRSKINLTGANFSGAILARADFSDACLMKTKFIGTNLRGANFSNHTNDTFFKVGFSKADLRATEFMNVALDFADFSDASHLSLANFTDCYFENCYIKERSINNKFEIFKIDERTDENGEPIYPKSDPDYRYIKLKTK